VEKGFHGTTGIFVQAVTMVVEPMNREPLIMLKLTQITFLAPFLPYLHRTILYNIYFVSTRKDTFHGCMSRASTTVDECYAIELGVPENIGVGVGMMSLRGLQAEILSYSGRSARRVAKK